MSNKAAIYKKIANIMKQVNSIEKSGYNSFHKYSYTTEDDVVETVRPVFLEQGLAFFASVLEQTRDGEFTKVKMEFTLADIDTGEELKSTFWGEGQDKGDKGLYKAYTGATKYFLMKTFLIATKDEPEADTSVDRRNVNSNNRQRNQGNRQGNNQGPAKSNGQGNNAGAGKGNGQQLLTQQQFDEIISIKNSKKIADQEFRVMIGQRFEGKDLFDLTPEEANHFRDFLLQFQPASMQERSQNSHEGTGQSNRRPVSTEIPAYAPSKESRWMVGKVLDGAYENKISDKEVIMLPLENGIMVAIRKDSEWAKMYQTLIGKVVKFYSKTYDDGFELVSSQQLVAVQIVQQNMIA